MAPFLLAGLVVFGVNLVPAFAPPTWAVLVLFRLHADLPVVPLVLIGAVAAASGRFVVAYGARALRGRFSAARQQRLESWRATLVRRKTGVFAGLALFTVSPLPSGQLLAFFSGRVVSYAVYVGGASLVAESYGDVATRALRSPTGIGMQVLFTVAVALLPLAPWKTRPSGQVLN